MGAMDLGALDDREYREALLEAGIVEGRLHLEAYAHGFGASGMTFLDSEFEQTIGAPLAATLFTCVGVPTYRSPAGGAPGAPPVASSLRTRAGMTRSGHTGRPPFGAPVHSPVDMAHAHAPPVDPVWPDNRRGGVLRPHLLARGVRRAAEAKRAPIGPYG